MPRCRRLAREAASPLKIRRREAKQARPAVMWMASWVPLKSGTWLLPGRARVEAAGWGSGRLRVEKRRACRLRQNLSRLNSTLEVFEISRRWELSLQSLLLRITITIYFFLQSTAKIVTRNSQNQSFLNSLTSSAKGPIETAISPSHVVFSQKKKIKLKRNIGPNPNQNSSSPTCPDPRHNTLQPVVKQVG